MNTRTLRAGGALQPKREALWDRIGRLKSSINGLNPERVRCVWFCGDHYRETTDRRRATAQDRGELIGSEVGAHRDHATVRSHMEGHSPRRFTIRLVVCGMREGPGKTELFCSHGVRGNERGEIYAYSSGWIATTPRKGQKCDEDPASVEGEKKQHELEGEGVEQIPLESPVEGKPCPENEV